MTTIYILANAISPPGNMGGNTKIFLEFSRRWAKAGNQINVLTSEKGLKTCEDYSLINAKYFIVSSSKSEKFSQPIHNIIQTIKSSINLMHFPKQPVGENVVIYSASNLWSDVIPAIILKKRLAGSRWVGTCFLPIPNPFKGFEHAFDRKFIALPKFNDIANYLVEKVSTFFLVRSADLFFVTNDIDRGYFTSAGISSSRIRAIYGGVALKEIAKVSDQQPMYDGCFVGRLHPMKGVLYLIDIWTYVCKVKPDAKLALIGNGAKDFEQKVKDEIKKSHLERNIDLLGFVDGIKKYKILKSSKVFLHTSIYDNSGMTAAEGMACGLPAVRFDIPALRVAYPNGMLVVPLKDCKKFADAVLRLLQDDILYDQLKKQAIDLAKRWDWDRKAPDALDYILKSIENESMSSKSKS